MIYEDAMFIAEEVLRESAQFSTLVRKETLSRFINRERQKIRPIEPTYEDFELTIEFIEAHYPNMQVSLHEDTTGAKIIFVKSTRSTQILNRAKHLFSDGTFKECPKQFKQIFSIHAFIKSGEDVVKSVPLAFFLTRNRKTPTYRKVFLIYLYIIFCQSLYRHFEAKLYIYKGAPWIPISETGNPKFYRAATF